MAIPILVEDQEKIPEGYTDLYKETDDGKYILDVEGVDNHPEVSGLKTAYQKEKEKRQKLAQQRDELNRKASMLPEDVDEDTLTAVLDKLKEGKDPFADNTDMEKVKSNIEKRYKAQLDELSEGLTKKEKQVQQLVIDSGLSDALAKNNVTNPVYQKAAKKLLADQVKVQEDENGQVQAFAETDKGEVPLSKFVQDWTAGDEGSAFVDGSSGSGARGTSLRGRKEVKRSQFEELAAAEQHEFIKNGGKVVD